MEQIPLTKASHDERDRAALAAAMELDKLDGGGRFSHMAESKLADITDAPCVLLTQSGTAALEMAMLLADLEPGDEVIMPSFTFSSTANAVLLRRAVPVFVDIDRDTFNLSPQAVEAAITDKTKAIVPVHYAGVGCDMEALQQVAVQYGLLIIEDAAHAIGATYRNRPLGSFGAFAAFSFHASKNICCGEGGAIVINDEASVLRAEILLEKGTSRRQLMRGEIAKYTWLDVGSSYLPSELTAALLNSQLDRIDEINGRRLDIWNHYASHPKILELQQFGKIALQTVPEDCEHNAHLFVLLLESEDERDGLSRHLASKNISAWHHYVPLHNSEAGQKYCRTHGSMDNTLMVSQGLIRLPLFADLSVASVNYIVDETHEFLTR